jgi:hypothetical protein
MGLFNTIRMGSSAAEDYEVERSLRFVDDDTYYLSRTPSSAGDRKKWTFSAWIKRGDLGGSAGEQRIFGGNANASHIYFPSNDEITWDLANEGSGSSSGNLNTTQVFRDPSAWFHLVCALDTDESTADNRMRMYVNGTEVTSFGSRSNPSSGYATNAMNNNTLHTLGYRTSGQGSAGMEFDGYMAEINFIDGQQYDASYFGKTDAITGQWNPKKYAGSYGTNGFYINFSDNSDTSATTLGKDSSGNGNNWTPNNFSVASGLGNDSFEDTPTNNFPTLNPNHAFLNGSSSYASEANLQWNSVNNNQAGCPATMAFPTTGKWYWEVKLLSSNSNFSFGITPATYSNVINPSSPTGSIGYAAYGSKIVSGTETASWAASFSNSDNIGAALDMDNNEIKFYKNNSLVGTISLVSGYENVEYLAWIKGDTASTTIRSAINFGGNGFVYTPPTGFKALSSANLPDPTILLPNKHFDTLLWTGTAASHTLTGLNFQPDWFWAKARSVAYHNTLMDSVRGSDRQLWSNRTNDEQTDANFLTSFNSNGVTLGDNSSGSGATNTNGHTYVGWNWNAGDTDGKTYTVTVVSDSGNKYRFDGYGTSAVTLDLAEGGTYIFNYPSGHPFRFSTTADGTHGGGSEYTTGVTVLSSTSIQIVVAASAPNLNYYCSSHSGMGGAINTNSTLGSSNFDGSIQTTVKANTTAGFSIISHTGSGAVGTIGHGLGVKPDAIFFKNRTQAHGWLVYHSFNGATKNLSLSNNAAVGTANNKFNDTEPTSSVITLKTAADSNQSGQSIISYCFSEVAGYSKFGSYTGNGSSDGSFVFTGFRPAFVLIKSSSNTENWYIIDNKRPEYNGALGSSGIMKWLKPNESSAENQNGLFNFLSNGFKLGYPGADTNGSGRTYIYLAFAESPFKNSRAR